jgi:polyhydroxybutyrate depolymerase
MLGLIAGANACSSSGSDAPNTAPIEGGTGGELASPAANGATASAGDQGGGEGSSSAPEGNDPRGLPNVAPLPESDRVPARPSAGCGLAGLGSGEQAVDVDGAVRSYRLDLPAAYDGTTPYPLVFAFHGATTSGALFRSARYGNLLSTMAEGAILVHPDALGEPSAWNEPADLPFFDALLAALDAALCVDRARVFATGHSSGGFFANALGCQRGDRLRAIAPVSAGGPFERGSGCVEDVAVWLAHADNDPTVDFENGVASRDRWLEANGCAETSTPSEPAMRAAISGHRCAGACTTTATPGLPSRPRASGVSSAGCDRAHGRPLSVWLSIC